MIPLFFRALHSFDFLVRAPPPPFRSRQLSPALRSFLHAPWLFKNSSGLNLSVLLLSTEFQCAVRFVFLFFTPPQGWRINKRTLVALLTSYGHVDAAFPSSLSSIQPRDIFFVLLPFKAPSLSVSSLRCHAREHNPPCNSSGAVIAALFPSFFLPGSLRDCRTPGNTCLPLLS